MKTVVGVIVLAIFLVVSFTRNAVFIDDITLWKDTTKKSPGRLRTHTRTWEAPI